MALGGMLTTCVREISCRPNDWDVDAVALAEAGLVIARLRGQPLPAFRPERHPVYVLLARLAARQIRDDAAGRIDIDELAEPLAARHQHRSSRPVRSRSSGSPVAALLGAPQKPEPF